jgi:transposase
MTDPQGVPLAVLVSAANQHDVKFMLPLVFCHFPSIGGVAGRPPAGPKVVRADAGYTSKDLLYLLRWCGIRGEIPQRGESPAVGLGKRRWPVERTIAWLKQYRRVGIRRERKAHFYEAFVTVACAMITYKQIVNFAF